MQLSMQAQFAFVNAHLMAVLRSMVSTSSYAVAAVSGAAGLDRSCSSCSTHHRTAVSELESE
jgi:hypothetical protein